MQKSAEACQREGVIFVPMVTESFGGLHEVAVREVVIANREKDALLGKTFPIVKHLQTQEAGASLQN